MKRKIEEEVRHLNYLMGNVINENLFMGKFLLSEGDELPIMQPDTKYKGWLDGDFDSNASKQSWGEFLNIYLTFGAPLAIAEELSTWRGKIKTIGYRSPFNEKMQLPETYNIFKIGPNKKNKDFIKEVKEDTSGNEYYEYKTSSDQNLNLYLPSPTFYSAYADMVYKFETEEGHIYSLILELTSQDTKGTGDIEEKDNFSVSIKNSSPNTGNGWFFKPPADLEGNYYSYFRKLGSKLIPYNVVILNQETKSSMNLWWDHWGVTTQVIVSIALSFFTAGLSAAIQGVFLRLSLATFVRTTTFIAITEFLVVNGAFNVARSEILALFLLEMVVNVPAALIDLSYNNKFGFYIGLIFCFFPVISAYGKLGRFIKGAYDQAAVKSLLTKFIGSGINQNSSQKQILNFIVGLTGEEKLMFSTAIRLAKNTDFEEALISTLKQIYETGVKNKEITKGFQTWLKVGVGSTIVKTLGVAGTFLVVTAAGYLLIDALIKKNGDKRTKEEVVTDASKSIEKYVESLKDVDSTTIVELPSTYEIIESLTTEGNINSTNYIYDLSKETEINQNFLNHIKKIKEEEFRNELKKMEGTDKTLQAVQDLINIYNKIVTPDSKNSDTKQLIYNLASDEETYEYLVEYENEEMIEELKVEQKKYKCLAKNFNFLGGYSYSDETTEMYNLKYEILKDGDITVDGKKLRLNKGQDIFIKYNGQFTYKYLVYNKFSCE